MTQQVSLTHCLSMISLMMCTPMVLKKIGDVLRIALYLWDYLQRLKLFVLVVHKHKHSNSSYYYIIWGTLQQ